MPIPPPPPLPPPVYYPQTTTTNQSSSNANGSIEEGLPVSRQPPIRSPLEMLYLSLIHNFTQLCLGGVVISALIIPLSFPISVLMQHTVLCTVGYFIIMAQGILAYSPVGWANHLKYDSKKIIHSTMQICGSILAISGSAVIIAETNLTFTTSHGICGLVATILTVINLLAGIFNMFFNRTRKLILLKILHICLGALTISVAFIALILAFDLYYREENGDINANLAIALSVFALFGILLLALLNNRAGQP
ncbi:unnamed protein product [Arctia plantaginis]|uniref:ascorbate ferrireductase (transmembrane) n=1 Tax=Arctia plantaginis TaxID=874455 RepID=A0A8S0Z839_ARCPL|nr:unnamed protein product [Arctia plantaginis]